eukprot:178821-Prorocentrum_minimum.AAC.1
MNPDPPRDKKDSRLEITWVSQASYVRVNPRLERFGRQESLLGSKVCVTSSSRKAWQRASETRYPPAREALLGRNGRGTSPSRSSR